MDARNTYRVRAGLLAALAAAASAAGCGTPGGFRTDPPPPDQSVFAKPNPPPAAAAAIPSWSASAGGTVVGAAGTQGPGADGLPPMFPPQIPGSGDPLPQPRPVPPGGGPATPPGYPRGGAGGQGGPGGAGGPSGPVAANDPHRRQTPTVTGGMLELAPWEVPTDRVIELGKQLELALAQNRDLVARIKELEGLGYGREQALAEAMRAVESASADAANARAALQATQAQVAALQERLRGIEREDINLFKAVIEALGKLLAEGKR